MRELKRRVTELLYQRDGALTADLAREPAGFSIGQVPARLRPDAVTSMVCGFCSTGCALDIHVRDGHAVNVTPTADYSVNSGSACPKGWEALAPLRARDRATTPLLRSSGGALVPVSWETAIEAFVSRMKAIQAKHGPESVAFLGTGQMPSE
jgi:anaerobic selenocysteine-containing dehydrogenase